MRQVVFNTFIVILNIQFNLFFKNNVASKGPELLLATKAKNKALALKLLNEGADIHYLDKVILLCFFFFHSKKKVSRLN